MPSSIRQFPELNEFLKPVIARERAMRAVRAAQADASEILREQELEILHADTDFDEPREVQRWALLLLGFQTGLRAETIRRLSDCFLRPRRCVA